MLQPRPAEVFPTISVDRSYAESVASFDVDAEKITDHLRDKGLTDEDIANLTIHFSSDIPKQKKTSRDMRKLGQYQYANKTIEIYRPQVLLAHRAPLPAAEGGYFTFDADALTSEGISSTTYHELEHHVDATSGTLDEESKRHNKEYRKRSLKLFSKYALRLVFLGGAADITRMMATGPVADVFEAQGLDSSAAGGVTTAASFCALAVVGYLNLKKHKAESTLLERERYLQAPIEVKARLAEERYQEKIVSIAAKPQNHESLDSMFAAMRS